MFMGYRDVFVKKTHQLAVVWGLMSVVIGMVIVWPADAGTITGQILYQGAVPSAKLVKVSRDADFCGETWKDHPVRVNAKSGGLLGVIISVEGIPVPPNHHPPVELVLSNKECRFTPQTAAAQLGKFLHIQNGDPLLHNTHIYQGKRTLLNVALVPGGRIIKKRVKRSGILRVKCDKHVFMHAHIAVFDHPFFSLTDHQGMFRITDLPAGTHTLTIWHETLGTRSAEVMVPKKEKPLSPSTFRPHHETYLISCHLPHQVIRV